MNARRWVFALAICAVIGSAATLESCHASAAAGALTMTSLAGGAAAVRRANGECYTDCLPGRYCNRETGLCDLLACAGKCSDGFVCQQTETGSACVPPEQTLASIDPHEGLAGPQPFGDGQAAQGPSGALGVAGGGRSPAPSTTSAGPPSNGPTGIALPARAAGDSSSSAPMPAPGSKASSGAADGGTQRLSLALDGGVAVPAKAIQTSTTRMKDGPVNTTPAPAIFDNNPWDPHHVDPVPQMADPNQPPPH